MALFPDVSQVNMNKVQDTEIEEEANITNKTNRYHGNIYALCITFMKLATNFCMLLEIQKTALYRADKKTKNEKKPKIVWFHDAGAYNHCISKGQNSF